MTFRDTATEITRISLLGAMTIGMIGGCVALRTDIATHPHPTAIRRLKVAGEAGGFFGALGGFATTGVLILSVGRRRPVPPKIYGLGSVKPETSL